VLSGIGQVTSSYVLCRRSKAHERMNLESRETRGRHRGKTTGLLETASSRWEQITQCVCYFAAHNTLKST
jgi:hypothetical protein